MWRLLLGTMGVKSLVQGLNAAAVAGFEPRIVWSEVRRRNRLATAPPPLPPKRLGCLLLRDRLLCHQATRHDHRHRSHRTLADPSRRITQGRQLLCQRNLQGFVSVLAGPTWSILSFDISKNKVLVGTTFYASLEREDENAQAGTIFIVIATVLREIHASKVIDDYPSIFDCAAEQGLMG